MRIHGFVSKPEIQKLNRNSIFIFVNGRLIRDRLVQHGLTEAYRNIMPPTVYPVVLLFLELPAAEVDVNVHPSKTEVRFRQQSAMHDFVRDTIRAALMKARPVPQFVAEIRAHATASQALTPGSAWEPSALPGSAFAIPQHAGVPERFDLQPQLEPPVSARFQFEGAIAVEGNAAIPVARGLENLPIAPGFSPAAARSLDDVPGFLTPTTTTVYRVSEFTVTGVASSPVPDPSASALAAQASKAYHGYVVSEVQQLVASAAPFTAAIKAGDIAAAKAAYGPARTHYESIEPVAESFGDLDPAIDARIDDIDDPSTWTGFHRLEKALWQDNSLAGMGSIADKLTADIAKLQSLVADQVYQPAQIANGCVELLDEVGASKVTGEEDRYSHTDLYDFDANVQGAKEGFTVVEPLLKKADANLASTIEARFSDVLDALQPYRQGDGWVDYSTVTQDQRRVLAQKVDALAEPLSHVAALVG